MVHRPGFVLNEVVVNTDTETDSITTLSELHIQYSTILEILFTLGDDIIVFAGCANNH